MIHFLHVGLFTPGNIQSTNASGAEQMTEKNLWAWARISIREDEKIQLAAWAVPELGDTGMQAQGSCRS